MAKAKKSQSKGSSAAAASSSSSASSAAAAHAAPVQPVAPASSSAAAVSSSAAAASGKSSKRSKHTSSAPSPSSSSSSSSPSLPYPLPRGLTDAAYTAGYLAPDQWGARLMRRARWAWNIHAVSSMLDPWEIVLLNAAAVAVSGAVTYYCVNTAASWIK